MNPLCELADDIRDDHAMLWHLHELVHQIITQQKDSTMDIQSQINDFGTQITGYVSDIKGEIEKLKAAHPDLDLSGLQTAVSQLHDLDTANADTDASSQPATTDVPAAVATTDAPAVPATDAATQPANGLPTIEAGNPAPATDTATQTAPATTPAAEGQPAPTPGA